MKIRKIYKSIMAVILCITLMLSLVGCGTKDEQPSTDSYVKDDGTVVVDGVEIQDVFVKLQLDGIEVKPVQVLDIDVNDIVVNSINIESISVLEAEVVSLNDEFVYLAYQNFVSYYEEDIDWETFIKDVAIGGTCILVCVTLSTVGGPVGTFFGAVICSEFTASALAVGAAIDAAVSGYMAYQEGGDLTYILGHMLNGVADGFKWAAILAPLSGGISGIQALKAVNQMKKLPGFSELPDKAINQLLKEFNKIAKSTAKAAANSTDDALRVLYREVAKELSSEITEDMFIAAFRNSDSIIKIIQKLNPFNTSKELQSVLKSNFFKKANVSDDAAKKWIKSIQNKTVKKLDDITDDSLRKYISENMYDFVQIFGKSASNDFIDDCLKRSLKQCVENESDKAFSVLKTVIAKESNSYCKLVAEIGKDAADKILENTDALILLQVRYGEKNVNKLLHIKNLYKNLTLDSSVDTSEIAKIIDGLMDGSISSIDDITKVNANIGTNAYKSGEAICSSLKNLGIEAKVKHFVDDVSAARLEFILDSQLMPNGAIDDIVINQYTKTQILEKYGEKAYQELLSKSDGAINALALQNKLNKSLVDDLFVDSLAAQGIPDTVIKRIKSGNRIAEWSISESDIVKIGNSVADYYHAIDKELYHNYIGELAEVRSGVARWYNEAVEHTPINSRYYLGTVMTPNSEWAKAKYGDVYMNTVGYPIFDEHSIARLEISDLTGIEADDIAKANLLHHGTTSNVPGYTWHHVEDGKTMLLIPTDLHEAYRHSGGASLIRDGAFDEIASAKDMLIKIQANNGMPLTNYEGGRTFLNAEQRLPLGVNYKEYDVNPRVAGQSRDAKRIVIGDDGSAWYTNDHYETFIRIQ